MGSEWQYQLSWPSFMTLMGHYTQFFNCTWNFQQDRPHDIFKPSYKWMPCPRRTLIHFKTFKEKY